jgi:hypothetical protein
VGAPCTFLATEGKLFVPKKTLALGSVGTATRHAETLSLSTFLSWPGTTNVASEQAALRQFWIPKCRICEYTHSTMQVIVSYSVTFLLGLGSGYILFRLQDRRQTQRTLSRTLYMPLHEDLHTCLERIKNADPFQDYSNWKNARASGLVLLMDEASLPRLEKLFGRTLPEYVNAWCKAKDWIDRILRVWGRQLGASALPGVDIENINWLNLLAQTTFSSELARIRSNTQVQLLEGFWHPGTTSFEDFAEARWKEVFAAPELSRFRNAREAAIFEISAALVDLGKRIRKTV